MALCPGDRSHDYVQDKNGGGSPCVPWRVIAAGSDWAVVRDSTDRVCLIDPSHVYHVERDGDRDDRIRQMIYEELNKLVQDKLVEMELKMMECMQRVWDQKIATMTEHVKRCDHCAHLMALDHHVSTAVGEDVMTGRDPHL